ncbi:Small GTP-binding protein [Elusimicrobium minutum Pei191]|uniref:Small GTP-binding protein n=2 Tax=Elusimicrobium TaxID=423604 RepID=B2KB69_ELUMP|nr:Small GTP-binding protein [Elusimicrobium minutum Pei191]
MNVGKSSLFNALAGRAQAIVDSTPGTTTDPVRLIIEIEGLGPVVLLDTGGIDDKSTKLGERRVLKSVNAVNQIDLALLVFTDNNFGPYEQDFLETIKAKKIPVILIHNKSDLTPLKLKIEDHEIIDFSAKNNNTAPILEAVKTVLNKQNKKPKGLLDGIVKKGDTIILVMPIDASAPQGRLILPQVQTIRAALDLNAVAIGVQVSDLKQALNQNPQTSLVITDSQAFKEVNAIVPQEIALTSFSILLARQTEEFEQMLKGVKTLDALKDGDKILILESCTHTVNECVDIGRTKIPNLIKNYSGKNLEFTIIPGLQELPENLAGYKLAVQCGGCMITQTQLKNRLLTAIENGLAVTNYGMSIAYTNGIFKRSVKIFKK